MQKPRLTGPRTRSKGSLRALAKEASHVLRSFDVSALVRRSAIWSSEPGCTGTLSDCAR
jgi:hypothetical protein